MDLRQIRFKGYDVNGSSLEIHDDSKGGKFKVSFADNLVNTMSDEDGNLMYIDVNPIVTGYDSEAENEDTPIFEVKTSLTLTFECEFKEEVPQDFYLANTWYFESYIYIATKLSIENILRDTVLEDIILPWSPPL